MLAAPLLLELPDAAATDVLGAALARSCPGAAQGCVCVYLTGELGAGKTACVRSLLRGLGVANRVRSPTYSMVETYELAALTAVHLDLYRLRSPEDLDDLGLRELLRPGCLLLIEWPARAGGRLPGADLDLALEYVGAGRRARLRSGSALGAAWRDNLLRDSSLIPYVTNLT
jgi:tRNA threonylcarbamoyladenosine biosynthesis protein TsaE